MEYLKIFMRWELIGTIAALAVVIGYRLLTGAINLNGLLRDKKTSRTSAARVQLLILTMYAALYYAMLVLKEVQQTDQNRSLPDLPQQLLYAIGAGHALFLGAKSGLMNPDKAGDGNNGAASQE
jgi:hypothetical protein